MERPLLADSCRRIRNGSLRISPELLLMARFQSAAGLMVPEPVAKNTTVAV